MTAPANVPGRSNAIRRAPLRADVALGTLASDDSRMSLPVSELATTFLLAPVGAFEP